MAQLVNVRLNRGDAQPWGFRLQGGKDFGTPLVVQKVVGGSIAANAGLVAGDSVIKVNGTEVYNLRHKDAQDAVVRGGNNFEITVQRGGSTWKPTVTPTGGLPTPAPTAANVAPVTRTSLAAKPQEVHHIGSGFNSAARPFIANGSEGVKSIVNKQYNTPVGIYSDESIAETLSAQAEVLAGGVLGVNFKKNERIYNSANSEVFKMLQEAENDPNEPEESSFSPTPYQSSNQQPSPVGGVTKHVMAPVAQAKPPNTGGLPVGQNICAECERLIVGVFVRIKEKNLHVDCFKCATCGTPLKNQGYFNINNKLYCDIHAKLIALQNPPPGTEGYLPVPIKPNTKLSASTISAALSTHHGSSATNGTSQSLSTANNTNTYCPQAQSSCESTPKKLSPMASLGVSPIHSRQNSDHTLTIVKSDSEINDKNVYNILKSCQSHDGTDSAMLGPMVRTYLETDFNGNLGEHDTPDEGANNQLNNGDFHYKTINGSIIRSVHAPGKGKSINYKVNTNISGPKPFSFSSAPLSPPSAGPKSPSTYPPPTNAAAWSQPKPSYEAPKPATFASATLPRSTVGPAAPGRFNTFKPGFHLNTESQHLDEISHELATTNFIWPPPDAGVDSSTPTATPLYVPPPETQHAIVKPLLEKQSQSAPELSYGHGEMPRIPEVTELESGSESYTSTSATTTTSEDHMRMYNTQTSMPSYTVYESAESDVDYSAVQHHKQSICSAEVSSFSSVHGAQYLADTLDTTCLVERMRSLTPRPPSPTPIKTGKHVEFAEPPAADTATQAQEQEPIQEAQIDEQFQPIDMPESKPVLPPSAVQNAVPQEWESAMVKALKTAPETPYHITSVQQEAVEERCEKMEASESSATTTFQSVELKPLDVLIEKPAEGAIMSSLLTTIPTKSVAFEPKVTMEPIPLPEETKPYFPPPINMKVVADDSIPGRKSGMLEALITAPDRPYSPFGHEVSYQLDDLPRPTEKMTLRSALTVAPERSFTPVLFDSNGLAHPKQEQQAQAQTQSTQHSVSQSQFTSSQSSAFQSISQTEQMSQMSQMSQTSQSCRQEYQQAQSICQQHTTMSAETKSENQKIVNMAAAVMEQGQSYVDEHEKRITFPPPNPLTLRQSRFSSLHKPDNIPVYQKNIKQLPSQQSTLPPVSPQLKENVPLAFFDAAARECLPENVAKPVAINGRSGEVKHDKQQADKHEHYETYAQPTGPITMTFQSLDGIENRAAEMPTAPPPQIASPIPHPRPFTPSLINKPAPIIPYYQQNLAISEFDPHMGEIFDPKLRTPSPCMRERSPAPGPPPNPLRIHAPRLNVDLPPGAGYTTSQIEAKSMFQQKPEQVECQRFGNTLQQTRTNEASLNRSMHAEQESASATQIGNTFVQKRSRVVEEFERSQTAKTVEIYKSGAGEVITKISEDEMPPKGIVANQARRFSQEVTTPPKVTFPASIPLAPLQFPLEQSATPAGSNTVAPPPGFNLKSTNAQSAFASSSSSSSVQAGRVQNINTKSTLAFTNTPSKLDAAAKLASVGFKPLEPQTPPPPPTNNYPSTAMSDPSPDASAGPNRGGAGVTSAPKRGRGVLNKAVGPGGRIPQCGCCNSQIRGPFITALGRIWCPDHFVCVNGECRRPLADIGFVEEKGNLYCEFCFEKYIAPSCSKCGAKVKGDCLNAIGKHFHPECFTCSYCGKLFGNSPFFLEEGNPYCEADWNEMFTTKCFACGFPVEAGDRWVEALSHNYHSQCFNCTTCKKNLEGQSFFAKGGRPYCKNHAR
ncbi:hypothetical protein DMENIID0001_149950 [Sergentomyia squamirostris]